MGRYLIIGLLCIGVLGTSALGAGTNRGRSKQQLAKAWGSFYAGKYRDVVKLTDPLTKLRGLSAPIQREAMHLQARALWATGDKRSQSKGQRYWELLGKKSGGDVSSWMTISKALQAKNPNLESLEKIVRRKSSPVAAEAGIELAHQYVEAKRFDDAGELLKHLSALLKDKKTLTVMETTPAEVKPFADEIAAALGRLKYQRNEGLKEFEAAEKLRKKRRFPQAIKVYEKIVKEFDQTPFAPRSDLHIGDCWLGLKQTDRAKNQWDEFVTSSPAGPWRGQAYVKLIDLALSNLDLTEAARYVQLARTGAQAAASSTSVDVSDSWSKARFDLAFRSGVVQYANGNPKQAADAFQAAQAATSKQQAGNIQRLIDAATTGKPLIPEECTTDSPGKPETALSLAMMFHLINQNTQAETFLSKLPRIGTKPQQAFALFLQGSILQSQNKLANAKAEFEKAIKTAPAAIFHDETLYRLATIIEKESSRKYRRPKAPKTKPGEKTKPLTAKQLTAQRHAEQKRQAALAKSMTAAVPYWQEIVKRYYVAPKPATATGDLTDKPGTPTPSQQKSPRVEQALDDLHCRSQPFEPWPIFFGEHFRIKQCACWQARRQTVGGDGVLVVPCVCTLPRSHQPRRADIDPVLSPHLYTPSPTTAPKSISTHWPH